MTARMSMAEPVLPMGEQSPEPWGTGRKKPMLPLPGGFLLRAGETNSKRSVGNKHEIVSKWLLTGPAVMISRTNWNTLSKHRTLTVTHRNLLRTYFQWGCPADEEDRARKPCALPHPRSLLAGTWETTVSWISHEHYLQETALFEAARARPGHCYTINPANPVHATPEQEQATQQSPEVERGLESRESPAPVF